MTPIEIRTVKQAFAAILGRRDEAASLLFIHLFDREPALRAFFAGDLHRRGRGLFNAAAMIVEDLHRLHIFVPALEALAMRCFLEPQHYQAIGDAVSRTARDLLGPDFTPALDTALRSVCDRLSAIMIGAADVGDFRLAA